MGWSRRLGIVAALLIGGASVVLAGQALDPGSPAQPSLTALPGTTDQGALPSPTPVGLAAAPELLPPAALLTNQSTVTLGGRLAEELPRDGSHRLRLYVNGELERDRRLPRRQSFNLEVPLGEGLNSITLAVHGPAGESLHSLPVEIVRDSTAPVIADLEPASGTIVYDERVTLRGTSEPGATLRVTSHITAHTTTLVVPDDGTFEVTLALLAGVNQLALDARDAAGNEGRASVTIERRDGEPSVSLDLSRSTLSVDDLPTTMTLRADVRDASGAPIDGAEVVFSFSPPGAPTLTYDALSINGVARWPSVRIPSSAGAGEGLATVLVALPDGLTLTASSYFTVEE